MINMQGALNDTDQSFSVTWLKQVLTATVDSRTNWVVNYQLANWSTGRHLLNMHGVRELTRSQFDLIVRDLVCSPVSYIQLSHYEAKISTDKNKLANP